MTSGVDPASLGQVGIVVRDLQASMEHYWKTFGIGPWKVHTNSAPPMKAFYQGRPSSYRARIGIARVGALTFELIQLLEGESIHRDFLETRGEGIEHLGIYVPDLDEALAAMRQRDVGVLQTASGSGVKGDGRYAYLDTVDTLGFVLELIQSASERLPPEEIYP